MEQNVLGKDQQKWIIKLMGYDFDIQYKLRQENRAIDTLLRQWEIMAISTVYVTYTEQVIKLTHIFRKQFKISFQILHVYQLKRGTLLYKDCFILLLHSTLILKLLHELHASLSGGHLGIFHIYKRVSSFLYCEGQKSDVQRFVAICEIYHRNKYKALKLAGLL